MKCEEIHELLARPSEWDDSDVTNIERHLRECSSCQRDWNKADAVTAKKRENIRADHLNDEEIAILSEYDGGPITEEQRNAWQHALNCTDCYAVIRELQYCLRHETQHTDEGPPEKADVIWELFQSREKEDKVATDSGRAISAPTVSGSAWKERLRSFLFGSGVTPKFALAALALVLAIGWIGQIFYQHTEMATLQDQLNRERVKNASRPNELAQLNVRLIPNDVILRGPEGAEEPTVIISSKLSLVNLELPTGAKNYASYRAVLEPLRTQSSIVTEELLTASQNNSGAIVVFSFPSIFLQSSQDYVIDLQGRTASGSLEKVNSFTFHVFQK